MIKGSLCFVFGSLFMLAAFQDNVLAMFASILMCINVCVFIGNRKRMNLILGHILPQPLAVIHKKKKRLVFMLKM